MHVAEAEVGYRQRSRLAGPQLARRSPTAAALGTHNALQWCGQAVDDVWLLRWAKWV